MTISAQAGVNALRRILGNLMNILNTGAGPYEALFQARRHIARYRLFPDMLPMTTQVQIACDAF